MLRTLWLGVFGYATMVDAGGMSGKFRNLSNRPMKLYWKPTNGGQPKMNGYFEAGGETSFQTYTTHEFFFAEVDANPPVPTTAPGARGVEHVISEEQLTYVFIDDTARPEHVQRHEDEMRFMDDYYERTGVHWIAGWPRTKPVFPLWPADEFGQIHEVHIPAEAAQYDCDPNTDPRGAACQREAFDAKIKVVARQPRAFLVEGIVSDFECDYIINISRPNMVRSTTGHGKGAGVDNVRTSQSYWLARNKSPMSEAIYRRVAALLQYPHELFFPGRNAEQINVLNYPKGGEYTPHYDWGAHGESESRFVSGLLYFNTPPGGGTTSFPKGFNEDGSQHVTVEAIKGNLLFFYDLLEDGNVDEYSLHSGDPVLEGEKWVGPLWVWDPHFSSGSLPFKTLNDYGIPWELKAAGAVEGDEEANPTLKTFMDERRKMVEKHLHKGPRRRRRRKKAVKPLAGVAPIHGEL